VYEKYQVLNIYGKLAEKYSTKVTSIKPRKKNLFYLYNER